MLAAAVWSFRRDEEYLFRHSLVLASAVSPDSDGIKDVIKSWDQFSDIYYPFQESLKQQRYAAAKQELERMSTRPMVVKPLISRRKQRGLSVKEDKKPTLHVKKSR